MARRGTTLPEFLQSPIVGEMLVGHLKDMANTNEAAQRAEGSTSSYAAQASVRLLRRAAVEIEAFHAAAENGDG